jgi:hypothetical protein
VVHVEAKCTLVEYVNRESNAEFDREVLTIGFARQMVAQYLYDAYRWGYVPVQQKCS